MSVKESVVGETVAAPDYSLWQLVLYALRLGTLGFGGPVALVGYMHRDLVEDRKWISEADYKEALALSQLMPGPLAAQLMIYIGFVHYRNLGATLAGVAFVVPSFVMVLLIGMAYVAGFRWVMLLSAGLALLSALGAWMLIDGKPLAKARSNP